MSNGNFVSQLPTSRKNGIQILKNGVTTAAETALLGARPESFRSKGMFEIAHTVQKVTGNECYD